MEVFKRKAVIFILIVVFLLVLSTLLGPYNVFHYFNAEKILQEPLLSKEFKGLKINEVKYKGDNTYLIKTDQQDFVVIQDYFSVMNYKWRIFEFEKELLY